MRHILTNWRLAARLQHEDFPILGITLIFRAVTPDQDFREHFAHRSALGEEFVVQPVVCS
jgi:hypothetical protein